jgi:hypothetical protein
MEMVGQQLDGRRALAGAAVRLSRFLHQRFGWRPPPSPLAAMLAAFEWSNLGIKKSPGSHSHSSLLFSRWRP